MDTDIMRNTLDFSKEQGYIKYIYETMGTNGVMGYLFSMFSRFMPVSRLSIMDLYKEADILVALGDLASMQDYQGFRLVNIDGGIPFSLKRWLDDYDCGEIVIDNHIDLGDDLLETRYRGYYGHHSRCMIPINTDGEGILEVSLYSDEYDVFSLETARDIQGLLLPLGSAMRKDRREQWLLRTTVKKSNADYEMLQSCPDMAEIITGMQKVARHDSTVILTGESGTGKTVTARIIHEISRRNTKPFVSVNCGALPESLADSLLFGYERGAFTGATGSSKGYFEQADGGTIFLDEIGDLTPMLQLKLLKVIDEKYIQRLGSSTLRPVNVRIITATNKDLRKLVREGAFREDLFFRLTTYEIALPPLRERRRDIEVLLRKLLAQCCEKLEIMPVPHVPAHEREKLFQYAWPGNIRELKNIIESALIDRPPVDSSFLLIGEYLQSKLKKYGYILSGPAGSQEEKARKMDMPGQDAPHGGKTIDKDSPNIAEDDRALLDDVIKKRVEVSMRRCRGRISGPKGAAADLGISRAALYTYLKRFGMLEEQG